jgi:dTDP-glucose 4,6-dehydratase
MGKKIVVIGSNSFSGQDFIDLLLDDPGTRVIGVSRSPERPPVFLRYKQRDDLSRYTYHQLDLNRDMKALCEMLDRERPEYIVNFAAQSEVGPSWDHPEHWFQTNCVALGELVNHLRKCDYLRRYVHISSPEVYGTCSGFDENAPMNPSTPYAASKAAADLLLKTYYEHFGFPVVTVRSTNVYGARQQLWKIIPRTIIYLKLGRKITLHGGGKSVKSYIHIRDISRGESAILESGKIGQGYHLSPERGHMIREIVTRICQLMGYDPDACTTDTEERTGQDAAYVISSVRARTELGWYPQISLEEGLSEVINWVNQNWNLIKNEPLEYQHKL